MPVDQLINAQGTFGNPATYGSFYQYYVASATVAIGNAISISPSATNAAIMNCAPAAVAAQNVIGIAVSAGLAGSIIQVCISGVCQGLAGAVALTANENLAVSGTGVLGAASVTAGLNIATALEAIALSTLGYVFVAKN